jgi:hypothetical protein
MNHFCKWYFEEEGKRMEANQEHDAFYKGMLESKKWVELYMRTHLFMDSAWNRI